MTTFEGHISLGLSSHLFDEMEVVQIMSVTNELGVDHKCFGVNFLIFYFEATLILDVYEKLRHFLDRISEFWVYGVQKLVVLLDFSLQGTCKVIEIFNLILRDLCKSLVNNFILHLIFLK